MVSSWEKVTCPVVIIHGKKDTFVPFGNVAFAEKMLVNAKVHYVILEESGHFIPWQNHDLVVEGILHLLNDTGSAIH